MTTGLYHECKHSFYNEKQRKISKKLVECDECKITYHFTFQNSILISLDYWKVMMKLKIWHLCVIFTYHTIRILIWMKIGDFFYCLILYKFDFNKTLCVYLINLLSLNICFMYLHHKSFNVINFEFKFKYFALYLHYKSFIAINS